MDQNTTAIGHQDATPEINNTGAISTGAELCKDVNKDSKTLIIWNNISQYTRIAKRP
ncbi:MAG: hypothetical protein ACR5K9_07180 [Wolbachia sp.]